MTRWVRLRGDASKWHVVDDSHVSSSGVRVLCLPWLLPEDAFSDFEPVEDECRQCRRALDGGKT